MGTTRQLSLPHFILWHRPANNQRVVNVCKLLSDQFTAEKAANGALTEPLREVFADRATGQLDQCSAGDGQDKGGEGILKQPILVPYCSLFSVYNMPLSDTNFSC